MSSYFYCTLYVTAEEPKALENAIEDIDRTAAKQAIRGGQPPPSGPPIDRWSSDRVGGCSWSADFTVIDMDASAWTAALAARSPAVRFDLIQVEGVVIPYPEGVRYSGVRQLTGVPLFAPGLSPDWAAVENAIGGFNPDDPRLIDGSLGFSRSAAGRVPPC